MTHKFIKIIFIYALFLTVFGFKYTNAQTITSLKVSPAFIENKVMPGELVEATVKISNLSDEKKIVNLYVEDIKGFSDQGLPIFSDKGDDNIYELSSWFGKLDSSIEIAPQSSKEVNINIAVPSSATLGRHLAGLFFREEGVADASFDTAVIVSTFVLGEANDKLESGRFTANRFIYSIPSVKFNLSLSNIGNSIVRPQGQIVISNFFGSQVAKIDVNNTNQAIYPGKDLDFEIDWLGSRLNWGRYQAVFSTAYGQDNKLLTVATSFWVLPLHILLGLFLAIIVLIAGLILIMRSYIKKKAWQYYQATAEAQGKELSKKDVPDILPSANFNSQRLLLVTISLLIFILILLALLYFI